MEINIGSPIYPAEGLGASATMNQPARPRALHIPMFGGSPASATVMG